MRQHGVQILWVFSRAALPLGAVAILLLCVTAGGCQRALFPKGEARNQFQVHDEMRQRYIPAQEYDVFGAPQPALRARLLR